MLRRLTRLLIPIGFALALITCFAIFAPAPATAMGTDVGARAPASPLTNCVGTFACLDIGVSVTIGSDSCFGFYACFGAQGNVGDGACNGDFACYAATGTVASGSCIGQQACGNIPGAIGPGSCIGEAACQDVAGNVGAGSCIGLYACQTVPGSIGSYSCNGSQICNQKQEVPIGNCAFDVTLLPGCIRVRMPIMAGVVITT